jgi:integrase/recombinase XerD
VTGTRVRRSIGTRDWARAKRLLDRWESDQRSINMPERNIPNLKSAIAQYLKDCIRRKLAPGTLRNYTKSLEHFQAFAVSAEDVAAVDVVLVRDFGAHRASLPGRRHETFSSRTLRKELEHIRAFCEFCVDNEWLKTNPARKVKPPKDDSTPTLPFTPEEVKALLAAVDQIDNNYEVGIDRARLRARALLLLLLYSGLRIGDAVKLERWRIDADGRLMIRMEKTREPLYVRLPAVCLEALAAVPMESKYFFWSGECKLETAVGSARRTVACLARITGIDAHPHRFRDTFSVELLKNGESLETVQWLLGHTSIRTTERHYKPWVTAFQQRLDRATEKLKFG